MRVPPIQNLEGLARGSRSHHFGAAFVENEPKHVESIEVVFYDQHAHTIQHLTMLRWCWFDQLFQLRFTGLTLLQLPQTRWGRHRKSDVECRAHAFTWARG